jgi:hypothetical protein
VVINPPKTSNAANVEAAGLAPASNHDAVKASTSLFCFEYDNRIKNKQKYRKTGLKYFYRFKSDLSRIAPELSCLMTP